MAFRTSYSDGALSADVQRDANPGANSLKYRTLLKEIDNGLGVRDMEKLKYLCQDLGVAPRKFETMTRGIYLFTELEKLALITADDISMLVVLMQAINRYDLVKKLKSWSSKEGNLAHRLSAYRRLMLRISDCLSRDERDQFTFYLSGGDSPLPVAAIEECKSLLQLFVLMEKYTLIGPGDLEYFTNIMQSIGNIAIVKEIEKYLAIERSIHHVHHVHHAQPSSSQSKQFHQGGGVAYNTGNQSNMRSNSAPTFEGYTQNPPWDGQDYQGKPPPQQQQPYNYPPQQYQQPQQQATPSYSQQNPQQWQHGQQPVIKKEPEDRTSSATSGLTVGPERPKWYYEAVKKTGVVYADKLWENVVQGMKVNEVRKKMQEMKIAEQRRAAESMPSVKTEPGDDERVASVTRDLRLGPIEDTTRSPEQSSTLTNEGHRIVAAQTATVRPHPNTDAGHMLDLPKYKMDRLPRGLCIIFNAENFTRKNLHKRDGTEKDVEALLNTFQNRLKFKIRVEQDPTADKYLKCLQEIARSDHSEYDCFVCIILSHGCKGHVYGTDGRLMPIDALTGLFRGEYVPSLVNKPKLFFIQACQGDNAQRAVDIQQDATTTLPNESDTLVSMSTVSGYASNRSVSQGTWFISSLCMVINSYYKQKLDLLSMLTIVNDQLSKAADKEKGKQIGNPSHTLRKQIYFNQGLGE
ncbi:uncharacterized protein LOC585496 isoform X1 [Strongylocentrotus purpuratus]|uniref:Caspase-8 n=1 Tax=Strongylocentrotus purpuratus TaxID=7668 RepID=A0A7M7RCX5_STRPU|nr:uncharacterized protein LOC585496 isoform X1 [Strongylocentrotus purpuratus]